eukprot:6488945-Pyramimonas_sp.AAC.1
MDPRVGPVHSSWVFHIELLVDGRLILLFESESSSVLPTTCKPASLMISSSFAIKRLFGLC